MMMREIARRSGDMEQKGADLERNEPQLLIPLPGDIDPPQIRIGKRIEGRGGKVKVEHALAARTPVDDPDCDRLATAASRNCPTAYRIEIWVSGCAWEYIEQSIRGSRDHIRVLVSTTTSIQSSPVEGALAGLDAGEQRTTAAGLGWRLLGRCRRRGGCFWHRRDMMMIGGRGCRGRW